MGEGGGADESWFRWEFVRLGIGDRPCCRVGVGGVEVLGDLSNGRAMVVTFSLDFIMYPGAMVGVMEWMTELTEDVAA